MDPRQLFLDERLRGRCAFCGGPPDTRDHVPPKVFLDEPYPQELPVVEACNKCNTRASLDEEYLACLLECVICGTADLLAVKRSKVRHILERKPRLRERIAKAEYREESQNPIWRPEVERVRRVMVKLAHGHAAYELYPHLEEPYLVDFVPLEVMSKPERTAFEEGMSGPFQLWPELGSRAFMRAVGISPDKCDTANGWIVVQPGRYRYAVFERTIVRIVLSEYLACTVVWGCYG